MSEKSAIDVIHEILTGAHDGESIDIDTFSEAADRLYEETGVSASDTVNEILRQIDAVLYANPLDGRIKLVRVGGGS